MERSFIFVFVRHMYEWPGAGQSKNKLFLLVPNCHVRGARMICPFSNVEKLSLVKQNICYIGCLSAMTNDSL